jgi:methyl-accepting chemotaxis protein
MSVRHYSLRTRLLAAFALIALTGLTGGVAAIIGLRMVSVEATTLYEKHLLGLSAIKEAEIHLVQVARYRAQFARASTNELRQHDRDLIEHHLQEARRWLQQAAPTLVTQRDQQALRDLNQQLDAYIPTGRAFVEAVARTELPSPQPELDRLNQAAIDAFKPVTDRAEQLSKHKEEVGAEGERKSQETLSAVASTVIGLSLFALVAAVGLGIKISANVLRQIGGEPESAVELARQVAAGDLSTPIQLQAQDATSILAAMKDMQTHLHEVVSRIRASADSIATASSEIAAGNADLSQRTEHQANDLQTTSSTMSQLRAAVEQNASSSDRAATMARSATQAAEGGGAAVARVVATMNDISTASRQISDIIGVIDSIAFQTNILALNAAVEAARAGEQGKGFAVVAAEVRSLAHRSSEAAQEIKSLITMSAERVENGASQVEEAGKTIDAMVLQVKQMAGLIEEISAATREQTSGIAEVGQSLSNLDDATQRNAALVEQSAAATDSLSRQASELLQSTSVFRL